MPSWAAVFGAMWNAAAAVVEVVEDDRLSTAAFAEAGDGVGAGGEVVAAVDHMLFLGHGLARVAIRGR